MNKLNKLAAAVAVALGLGVVPQAHAVIQIDSGGEGDALLFPAFHGAIDNYFTISNTSSDWIQGHLRLRGAGWSGELRDFDVILSPGDVFVFRIADIDSDGMWEIDASIDEPNFRYTGMMPSAYSQCTSAVDKSKKDKCIDSSSALVPDAGALAISMFGSNPTPEQMAFAAELRNYHLTVGYVEFIGEAVLRGMTHARMGALLASDNLAFQTRVNAKRGTTAWAWSNAEVGFNTDQGLGDVPNRLSGTAFLSIQGLGVAYNAESIKDFRTSGTEHRVDNYRRVGVDAVRVAGDNDGVQMDARAVILHDENGAITRANGTNLGGSPFGAYVYAFPENGQGLEDLVTEQRISFNNTWGPTLADGDDYSLCAAEDVYGLGLNRDLRSPCGPRDDWDLRLGEPVRPGNDFTNSIAEVEEAIRVVGQSFHSYYMDGMALPNSPDPLMSLYFAFFPTKFYYGESGTLWQARTRLAYLGNAIYQLIRMQKPVNPVVMDINEVALSTRPPTTECISPSTLEECYGAPPGSLTFPFELQMLAIGNVKTVLNGNTPVQPGVFPSGRVTMVLQGSPLTQPANTFISGNTSWPGLMYTFELGARKGMPYIAHWRDMQSDVLSSHPEYR